MMEFIKNIIGKLSGGNSNRSESKVEQVFNFGTNSFSLSEIKTIKDINQDFKSKEPNPIVNENYDSVKETNSEKALIKNDVQGAKSFIEGCSGCWDLTVHENLKTVSVIPVNNPVNIEHIKIMWFESNNMSWNGFIPHLIVNLFKVEDFYYYHCFNLLQKPNSSSYILDYTHLLPMPSNALNALIDVKTADQYFEFLRKHPVHSSLLKESPQILKFSDKQDEYTKGSKE